MHLKSLLRKDGHFTLKRPVDKVFLGFILVYFKCFFQLLLPELQTIF